MAVTKPTGFSGVPKAIYPITKDITSIGAAEAVDVDFAVPCDTGDIALLVPVTTPTVGIVWTVGRCATAGTMTFRFGNVTAAPIDLASSVYYVYVL